jgi:cytochrome c oxidase assembly factor CtaG
MNRCKDYACFIVWFAGLGYIVLWALTVHANASAALSLPPAFHVVGLLSATFVAAQFAVLGLRRWRNRDELEAGADASADSATTRLSSRWKAPAMPTVKPRSQFGLRGVRD